MKTLISLFALLLSLSLTAQTNTATWYLNDTSGNGIQSPTNTASGFSSTAMGFQTKAIGDASTSTGGDTEAIGVWSTAMGYGSTATGDASTAIGHDPTASGLYSVAIGDRTTASGIRSTAIGEHTSASGNSSTALGFYSTASGDYSVAIGYGSLEEGNFATGTPYYRNEAIGIRSHVIGNRNKSTGSKSFSIGNDNLSQGTGAFSIGENNISTGDYSMALGLFSESVAYGSFSFGNNAYADGYNTTAIGSANTVDDSAIADQWNQNNRAFVIGNGFYDVDNAQLTRSDAFTVWFNGDATLAGNLNINSDARLKANIVSLGSTLAKLLQIDGKSYTMKKDESEKQKIGLLAQDIEKVFPELVSESNGVKSVNYQGLVPVLINALKEQQSEIDELKTMLKTLIEKS